MMKKAVFSAILISLSFSLLANSQEPVDASKDIVMSLQDEIQSLAKKKAYIPLDIPGADRPEVERFRNHYLHSEKLAKRLCDDLERAQDYRIFVRKAVLDAELPLVLEYLPMVESNYNPNARSKSGAIGLWQFMENSVSASPSSGTLPLLLRYLAPRSSQIMSESRSTPSQSKMIPLISSANLMRSPSLQ